MQETRALAEFAHRTRFEDLPASVVDAMKRYTLDNLACGFVGSLQPWAKIVTSLIFDNGGKEEASIFTLLRRATAAQAALANGVMIGGFESEHIGHAAHPSGTAFPAALAIAERERLPGRSFITALALGYELTCRIGDAQTHAVETERGIHNPAANGPFGAAAAAGTLLGFDPETLAQALGIAGSHCGGLIEFATDGAMTKRLHLGRAAQLGLESALLAERGFTGPATILEGRYGYFHAYAPAPRLDLLLDGLGETWRLETLQIKAYPCHMICQAPVAVLQGWKRTHAVDPETVAGIRVRADAHLLQERYLNQEPATLLGAQYSLPFTLAVAVFRDLDDPLNYDSSVMDDARIRRLARAITWEAVDGDRPTGAVAELEISVDGRTHHLRVAGCKGSTEDPLTYREVIDKFARFTCTLLDRERQRAIIDAVARLEDLTDLSELTRLIRDV